MDRPTTRVPITAQVLAPSPESVARYLGGPGYRLTKEMRTRVCDSIDQALTMVDPVAGYRLVDVETVRRKGACGRYAAAAGDIRPDLLASKAPYFAVCLATLGQALETSVRHLSACNQMVAAMTLDAVGTAMLDAMGCRLEAVVDNQARPLGFFGGSRLGPGLNDRGLENQALLFDLLGGDTLGVRLNRSLVMQPAKSISAFLVFSDRPSRPSGDNKCRRCRMPHCQFRRVSA